MKEETLSNQEAPTTPSGEQVGSDALFAENVALRESLTELLALYDEFKGGEDQCFEDAYYAFYKGQYDKWENARNLLANVKEQAIHYRRARSR